MVCKACHAQCCCLITVTECPALKSTNIAENLLMFLLLLCPIFCPIICNKLDKNLEHDPLLYPLSYVLLLEILQWLRCHNDQACFPPFWPPISSKLQLCLCWLVLSLKLLVDCINLHNSNKGSELSYWPAFCFPHSVKANWIMPSVVVVVNPVIGTIVTWNWLQIFEQLPNPTNPKSSWIILNFI